MLTTSLLTDRMLWYSDFFPELRSQFDVTTWATAARDSHVVDSWKAGAVTVEGFPQVKHFRMFPHTYLRRLNEFVWDFRLQPPSRLSHQRHVEEPRMNAWMRTIKAAARLLALLRTEQPLERLVGSFLQKYPRSPEGVDRIIRCAPDMLLATGPHRFDEPGVVAIARNLKIPTLALITSWDNLSTKKRMLFEYDGYLVWSEQMKRELQHFYPHTRGVPVYVIGAPQFDVFFQDEFRLTREELCAAQGLRPEVPIIVYTLGSPNLVREHFGAVDMAGRIVRGELGDVQLLVRPHPVFDNAQEFELLRQFEPRVRVQRTGRDTATSTTRSQDRQQIAEWVNTFRHADVVVNFASTVTIDAAIFDRPVVNLDYDPEPGQPNQGLVNDANHLWTHFKPIAESGGVWNTATPEATVEAIRTYLQRPELHCEGRRWIVDYVCGAVDGNSGRRFARAVAHFAEHRSRPSAKGQWREHGAVPENDTKRRGAMSTRVSQ